MKTKLLALFILMLSVSVNSYAINVSDDGTYVGSFSEADCVQGVDCTLASGKWQLAVGAIGGTTANDATFSTVIASGIENSPIGSVIPADATFTGVVLDTTFTGITAGSGNGTALCGADSGSKTVIYMSANGTC